MNIVFILAEVPMFFFTNIVVVIFLVNPQHGGDTIGIYMHCLSEITVYTRTGPLYLFKGNNLLFLQPMLFSGHKGELLTPFELTFELTYRALPSVHVSF